jgi:hypothetical protein
MRNKFDMKFINIIFVYQWFFILKKWTKVSINFFLFDSEFDSERASGIISFSATNQKLKFFLVVDTFVSYLTVLNTF